MLPFLKLKQEGSGSAPVEHQMRESDEESGDYDMLHSAAEDLISAIHSKNVKSVAEALRAAFEMIQSQPQEENKDV